MICSLLVERLGLILVYIQDETVLFLEMHALLWIVTLWLHLDIGRVLFLIIMIANCISWNHFFERRTIDFGQIFWIYTSVIQKICILIFHLNFLKVDLFLFVHYSPCLLSIFIEQKFWNLIKKWCAFVLRNDKRYWLLILVILLFILFNDFFEEMPSFVLTSLRFMLVKRIYIFWKQIFSREITITAIHIWNYFLQIVRFCNFRPVSHGMLLFYLGIQEVLIDGVFKRVALDWNFFNW